MSEMKNTSKSGTFGVSDYYILQEKCKELEKELKEETDLEYIKQREDQIKEMKKDVSEGQNEDMKLRSRIKELQAEIKENSRRLELLQSGIDPDKKSVTRKRYISPGINSNKSKRSVGNRNFVSNNKRAASLSGKRKTPSYLRPTKQVKNRNQTTSRGPSSRFNSSNRSKGYSYGRSGASGNRSLGSKANSGSRKRSSTRPQVNGVFGRLYQSKQRDSAIRTNTKRASPGYRAGGYKRPSPGNRFQRPSPGNRFQRPSPGAQGVKKRSPSGKSGSYFQVSSRLYPGPGARKSRDRSKDKASNSRDRKSNSKTKYPQNRHFARGTSGNRSNSYGRVPRPLKRSGSGKRSGSRENASKPSTTARPSVFDRLYNRSTSRSNSRKRVSKKPPPKPSVNNYMNSSNNDL